MGGPNRAYDILQRPQTATDVGLWAAFSLYALENSRDLQIRILSLHPYLCDAQVWWPRMVSSSLSIDHILGWYEDIIFQVQRLCPTGQSFDGIRSSLLRSKKHKKTNCKLYTVQGALLASLRVYPRKFPTRSFISHVTKRTEETWQSLFAFLAPF